MVPIVSRTNINTARGHIDVEYIKYSVRFQKGSGGLEKERKDTSDTSDTPAGGLNPHRGQLPDKNVALGSFSLVPWDIIAD